MKFYDLLGALQRGRRFVSRPTSVSTADAADPVRVAEMLRQLSVRVQELEARVPPEAVEFEQDVLGGGASYSFAHGFRGPVRYYVTSWTGTVAPVLSRQSTSTENVLVLNSYAAGRAVIRIEPSQYGLS